MVWCNIEDLKEVSQAESRGATARNLHKVSYRFAVGIDGDMQTMTYCTFERYKRCISSTSIHSQPTYFCFFLLTHELPCQNLVFVNRNPPRHASRRQIQD